MVSYARLFGCHTQSCHSGISDISNTLTEYSFTPKFDMASPARHYLNKHNLLRYLIKQ